jgi:hypothetical protein
VGGVAGQTVNGDIYEVGISGEVTGADVVGGAAGDNGGGVMNVYSHANINGVPSSSVAGGLVGENHGFTIHSYSTGSVPNAPGKGGLIGHDAGSGGVFGSFWDTQTSGTSTSGEGTGKTTAEMKDVSTFTDSGSAGLGSVWDFVGNPNDDAGNDNIWDINSLINEGYPYLTNQTPAVPDTDVTSIRPSPTNQRGLTWNFTSSVEGSTFECKVQPDFPDYTPCSDSYALPTYSDGTYTFTVRAINPDGVVDPTPAVSSIVVDTAAPDTTITRLSPNPNGNPVTDFILTANETAGFICILDGAPYESCSQSYSTEPLEDGEHTLEVFAIDLAGNVDASHATTTWLVDTTSPDTFITAAPSDPTSTTTSNFEFSANEQPTTFECNLDNAGYEPCSSPFTTPNLEPGEHNFLVRATDSTGNTDASPASHTWTLENDVDSDGDGITDAVENDGPNNGDANNDGTSDAEQANVTSLLNLDRSAYVVLATSCANNSAVSIGTESSQHKDTSFTYPGGVISFTTTGCSSPSCVPCSGIDALGNYQALCCPAPEDEQMHANITLLLYRQTKADSVKLRKYNDSSHIYSSVDDAVIEAQTVAGNNALKVSYRVIDGSNLDADGAVNGTIVDPVGVAFPVTTTTSKNLVGTGQNVSFIYIAALTLTSFSIFALKHRYRGLEVK